MTFISMMQGRLGEPEDGRFQSFPRQRWRDEFAAAEAAGLDGIELIYDGYGHDVNPLVDTQAADELVEFSTKHNVIVRSVCADYFMDYPILRADKDARTKLASELEQLLKRCSLLKISRLVLPFVDVSRITSAQDDETVIGFLLETVKYAEIYGVELHLETDLRPDEFASLLDELPSPMIKVNYDSGNSASLGYDCMKELDAYGDRIGSVHIKDRVRGGGTVPLGTGDADLPTLFSGLATLGYSGDYVLQVARSTPGQEIEWARHNRQIVQKLIAEAGAR